MLCGPKFGMYKSGAAVVPLADWDFRTPVTQSFGSASATHQYLLQQTSGNYNDTGTGTTANIDTFTAGLQGQSRPGIWNGTDYTSIKAWETGGATARAAVSDTSVFDSNNTDLYFRIMFAICRAPTSAAVLTEKRTGVAAGWSVEVQTDGTIDVIIEDASANTITVSLTGNHCDGAPHYLEFFYDDSADELTVNSDLDDGNAATSTVAVTGSLTNAVAWRLGDPDSGVTASLFQVFLAEGGEGAAAQTMFDETGWWTHATDPSGLLDAPVRASLISVPVAAGYVAHFSDDTLPIGYAPELTTDASGRGLFTNSVITNLIDYSEELINWTSSNMTETDNFGDAPDGFRSATKLAATANNGYSANTWTSVAATKYTISVWIKEITVGCTGRLIFYSETGSVELASTVFTATSSWDNRVSVTATTNAGQVSSSLRIEIDTNTEECYAWGAQAELATHPTAYIRTTGATAATALPVYLTTMTAGQYCKNDHGEIEMTLINTENKTGNHRFLHISTGTGTAAELDLWDTTGNDFSIIGKEGSGTIVWNDQTTTGVNPTLNEATIVIKWAEDGTLANSADFSRQVNGGTLLEDIGTYTGSDLATKVRFGNYKSPSTSFATNAVYQRLRIWEAVR